MSIVTAKLFSFLFIWKGMGEIGHTLASAGEWLVIFRILMLLIGVIVVTCMLSFFFFFSPFSKYTGRK